MSTTSTLSLPAFMVGAADQCLSSTGKLAALPAKRSTCGHTVPVKTLQRRCPQRTAELIYLQLLAEVQLARFEKTTSFREHFAEKFAAACVAEKSHWATFYVRCQAKLGIKVLKNFEIVYFANSAKTQAARAKPC